jgi:hypothetical protein
MVPDAKLALGALARLPCWLGFALARRGAADNRAHAEAAIAWLARAEAASGQQGFAHSLHLARGWLPGYPETTGYIIPTLLLAAQRYQAPQAQALAIAAWQWLRAIQQEGGAFADLSGQAQVFDTGQILIGLNLLCARATPGAQGVAGVASQAARWLVRQQEPDGSFTRQAYNNRPHAYYSRVGAALLEAGQGLGLAEVLAAGQRNLEWTLAQQGPDGWFANMSFADHPPFSHTIVYTLEGLLAGYRIGGDTRLLDAVVRTATALRDRISAHGGVIRSQYREGFVPLDGQICVTGLCQWSALCFRLERLGVAGFQAQAQDSLAAAKRLQLWSPLRSLHGALPGSVPLSGRYMRYALPNWGVKFFLDALLEADGGDDLPALV